MCRSLDKRALTETLHAGLGSALYSAFAIMSCDLENITMLNSKFTRDTKFTHYDFFIFQVNCMKCLHVKHCNDARPEKPYMESSIKLLLLLLLLLLLHVDIFSYQILF